MGDYFDDYSSHSSGIGSFFSSLPPGVRAAIIFAIPFMAIDFFNYYSAGTALALSAPLLIIFYAGCGALGAKFAADQGRTPSEFLFIGATAGLALWLASTVVNTIISLIIGAASLGTTLLLGIPYLCICAPIQLIGGGLMGSLGGFLYGLFHKNSYRGSGTEDYYG
jgi:hypothetical protein